MATTFFPLLEQAAPVQLVLPSGYQAAWTETEATKGGANARLLSQSTSASTQQSIAGGALTATVTPQHYAFGQFCSMPLLAGTNVGAGSWTVGIAVSSTAFTNGQLRGYCSIYLMNGATGAIRTTIAGLVQFGGSGTTVTETTRWASTVTGGAATVTTGDYIMVELAVGVLTSSGSASTTPTGYTSGATAIVSDNAATADAQTTVVCPTTLAFGTTTFFPLLEVPAPPGMALPTGYFSGGLTTTVAGKAGANACLMSMTPGTLQQSSSPPAATISTTQSICAYGQFATPRLAAQTIDATVSWASGFAQSSTSLANMTISSRISCIVVNGATGASRQSVFQSRQPGVGTTTFTEQTAWGTSINVPPIAQIHAGDYLIFELSVRAITTSGSGSVTFTGYTSGTTAITADHIATADAKAFITIPAPLILQQTTLYPLLEQGAPTGLTLPSGYLGSYTTSVAGKGGASAALLSQTSASSQQSQATAAMTADTGTTHNGAFGQFVSAPLLGGTFLGGTWSFGFAGSAGAFTNGEISGALNLYLVNGATGAIRTTIITGAPGTLHTTLTEQTIFQSAVTGAQATATTGDYLVAELFIRVQTTSGTTTATPTGYTSGATAITADGVTASDAKSFLLAPGLVIFNGSLSPSDSATSSESLLDDQNTITAETGVSIEVYNTGTGFSLLDLSGNSEAFTGGGSAAPSERASLSEALNPTLTITPLDTAASVESFQSADAFNAGIDRVNPSESPVVGNGLPGGDGVAPGESLTSGEGFGPVEGLGALESAVSDTMELFGPDISTTSESNSSGSGPFTADMSAVSENEAAALGFTPLDTAASSETRTLSGAPTLQDTGGVLEGGVVGNGFTPSDGQSVFDTLNQLLASQGADSTLGKDTTRLIVAVVLAGIDQASSQAVARYLLNSLPKDQVAGAESKLASLLASMRDSTKGQDTSVIVALILSAMLGVDFSPTQDTAKLLGALSRRDQGSSLGGGQATLNGVARDPVVSSDRRTLSGLLAGEDLPNLGTRVLLLLAEQERDINSSLGGARPTLVGLSADQAAMTDRQTRVAGLTGSDTFNQALSVRIQILLAESGVDVSRGVDLGLMSPLWRAADQTTSRDTGRGALAGSGRDTMAFREKSLWFRVLNALDSALNQEMVTLVHVNLAIGADQVTARSAVTWRLAGQRTEQTVSKGEGLFNILRQAMDSAQAQDRAVVVGTIAARVLGVDEATMLSRAVTVLIPLGSDADPWADVGVLVSQGGIVTSVVIDRHGGVVSIQPDRQSGSVRTGG